MSLLLSLITLIIFNITKSLCQLPPLPNQWSLNNIIIRRWTKTNPPKVGISFELTRAFWKECIEGPKFQAWEQGEFSCGWVPVGQPLKCSNWASSDLDLEPSMAKFHSCSSYMNAFPGEEAIPEEVSKWLKWQIYDIRDNKNVALDPSNQPSHPLESLSMEIISGVPSFQ
jgi:hypothetical protein